MKGSTNAPPYFDKTIDKHLWLNKSHPTSADANAHLAEERESKYHWHPGFLGRFSKIEIHRPVVTAFNPGTADKVDAAIGQLNHGNNRFRCCEYTVICCKHIFENFPRGVYIILIANTKYQIHTTGVVGGVVDDVVANNSTVGDYDFFVVWGEQDGGEDLDALNHA